MTFKDVYWLRPIAIFLKTSFECKNKTKSASLHAIFHKMQTSPRRVEGKKSCIMMHEQILVKAKKKWGFEFFTIWFKLWTYIVASSHHLICIKNRQIWTGHKEIERLFSNPHALCEHLEEEEATPLSCLHSQLSSSLGKFFISPPFIQLFLLFVTSHEEVPSKYAYVPLIISPRMNNKVH